MSAVRTTVVTPQLRPSSRGGLLVAGCLLFVSVPLGFVAYGRFKSSDGFLAAQVQAMRAAGVGLSTEQCVDRALQMRADCQAMPKLCDHSVGETMDACLQARNRAGECATFGESVRSTRFGFDACKARKTDRSGRVACATAYRSIAEACSSPGSLR
jgi:hypothetical protein